MKAFYGGNVVATAFIIICLKKNQDASSPFFLSLLAISNVAQAYWFWICSHEGHNSLNVQPVVVIYQSNIFE